VPSGTRHGGAEASRAGGDGSCRWGYASAGGCGSGRRGSARASYGRPSHRGVRHGTRGPPAGGEGDARWGKSPVFWPNLDDTEGGARFVLDDPSEDYLWQGLDLCGRASVEAINRASQLVSRDMYNLAQVRLPPML